MTKAQKQKLSKTEMLERLKSLRLLSLDVDGILTDGGLYYTETGEELRKFNVKDGMGMKRARDVGVELAIISASTTKAIAERGKRLGVERVHIGAKNKLEILASICQELGIGFDQVGHMGDDLNDIPILKKVGFPMTVCDAVEEVKNEVIYITQRGGGQGAVRELCDMLVQANGASNCDEQ